MFECVGLATQNYLLFDFFIGVSKFTSFCKSSQPSMKTVQAFGFLLLGFSKVINFVRGVYLRVKMCCDIVDGCLVIFASFLKSIKYIVYFGAAIVKQESSFLLLVSDSHANSEVFKPCELFFPSRADISVEMNFKCWETR